MAKVDHQLQLATLQYILTYFEFVCQRVVFQLPTALRLKDTEGRSPCTQNSSVAFVISQKNAGIEFMNSENNISELHFTPTPLETGHPGRQS